MEEEREMNNYNEYVYGDILISDEHFTPTLFDELNSNLLGYQYSPASRQFAEESPQVKREERCVACSDPQLPTDESAVNLSQYAENETPSPSDSFVMSLPLYYSSLTPYPGPYNFSVSIPKPTCSGVKSKWCYSSRTKKLYAAKRVTFPVNIKMERFPAEASLLICPVFSQSSARTLSVNRCYLCQSTDQDPDAKRHLIQVDGSAPNYFCKDNRYMVSVPLPSPAPGDSFAQIFVKMTCNTSCVGGPNRRPFSILMIALLHNTEVGRQVIHTKCCEGPVRDMNKDEADLRDFPEGEEVNAEDIESVRRIASELANCRKRSKVKVNKAKRYKTDTSLTVEEALQSKELLWVPTRFRSRVKHFIDKLYREEQIEQMNIKFKNYFSADSDSD